MDTQSICDYLRPLLSTTYLDVRPAKKLEADINDRDAQLPLALIHPWKEEADQNRYDTLVAQRVNEHFAVITICKITDLKLVRDELFAVLLGAVLPDHQHEVIYHSGETLDLDTSVIWWRDIFTTSLERRQTS